MAVLTSQDYFFINGISSAAVGLYVDTPPVPPMSAQRVTTWATGIDMDSSSPDDVWENITLTISAYKFFKSADFSLADVYAFLADARTLQLSRFADRYFKVRQVKSVMPQMQYDGQRIKIQIGFVCAPFKYHVDNDEIEITEDTLQNPGTRYSRPVYRITHTGACSLTVNGEVLRIAAGAPSPIFVDAERMIAYSANGDNATKYTTGNFAFLKPGANAITASGCTVAVTGNWRDY
ncbi:MAG TPA: hypothetical protein DDX71_00690 [Ruminococcus sp.]|nr:hypothetical protein [Ruminococcus sp.]